MDTLALFRRLAENREVIRSLTVNLDAEEARWQPTPEAWSVLQIVNHLIDEEKDDFRRRLELTLHHPDEPWPPIDPEGWVHERHYAERDLIASLETFLRERSQSVAWLRSLESPDWNLSRTHPNFGTLSASDLLSAWVAHDHLHMRQMIRRRFQFGELLGRPGRTDYAGRW